MLFKALLPSFDCSKCWSPALPLTELWPLCAPAGGVNPSDLQEGLFLPSFPPPCFFLFQGKVMFQKYLLHLSHTVFLFFNMRCVFKESLYGLLGKVCWEPVDGLAWEFSRCGPWNSSIHTEPRESSVSNGIKWKLWGLEPCPLHELHGQAPCS